ncbi:FAD-binding oxidoreductase [Jiangella asiatica]|nr:FAD-binding oxidoreductase [Jiangella asiatica]
MTELATRAAGGLRQRIAGEVVLPADETYDDHRNAFQHEGSPAVIVRARTHDDVRHAIDLASEHDLVLSVRSGGHSLPGFGTNDGGVVLDLTLIDHVEVIDAARRIVRIGSGARWEDVARELGPQGLAISSGDTTKVGVGGLILGGGMGWMVRRYGLTIDALVAADVVTADGRVLRASAEENPDLFWALRGGGGNFGVVTHFELVAQPVREVYAGSIVYPRADLAAALKGWRDVMRAAPDELTTMVGILPEMLMPESFMIGVCVATGDAAAAEKIVEPLLGIAAVTAQTLTMKPYGDVLEEPPPPPPPGLSPVAANSLTADLSDELIDLYAAGLAGDAPMVGQLRALGGAMSRVPTGDTAFAYRDSEAMLSAVLLSPAPEAHAAFGAFRTSLAPHTRGSYGNLMTSVDPDDVAALYPPETYKRLVAIKGSYDPENVFRRNLNIPPT